MTARRLVDILALAAAVALVPALAGRAFGDGLPPHAGELFQAGVIRGRLLLDVRVDDSRDAQVYARRGDWGSQAASYTGPDGSYVRIEAEADGATELHYTRPYGTVRTGQFADVTVRSDDAGATAELTIRTPSSDPDTHIVVEAPTVEGLLAVYPPGAAFVREGLAAAGVDLTPAADPWDVPVGWACPPWVEAKALAALARMGHGSWRVRELAVREMRSLGPDAARFLVASRALAEVTPEQRCKLAQCYGPLPRPRD